MPRFFPVTIVRVRRVASLQGPRVGLEILKYPEETRLKAYFIRRLLLIPVTLLGITLLVFAIVRLSPGGPVQRELSRLTGGAATAERSQEKGSLSLTPAQVLEIEEKVDWDKPILRAYLEWLGALPRDLVKVGREFAEGENEVEIPLPESVHVVTAVKLGDGKAELEPMDGVDLSEWEVRLVSPEEQAKRFERQVPGVELEKLPGERAVLFRSGYDGLLQGSLRRSQKYDDPVWGMILERMPVSLFYGGVSMVLIYAICLPLGVLKAIRHRSWLDNASSVLVFAGYAVPGYALGAVMMVYLGAKWSVFPLGGFVGDNFEELSAWGKVIDYC